MRARNALECRPHRTRPKPRARFVHTLLCVISSGFIGAALPLATRLALAQGEPTAREQAPDDSLPQAESPPKPRPVLTLHRGEFFQYSIPDDWQALETTHGVDLSAPDGHTGASFSLLIGGFGEPSPRVYLEHTVRSARAWETPRILSFRRRANEPGVPEREWQVGEAELVFRHRGRTTRAHVTVGVMQGHGRYTAFIRGYQAPAEHWERDRAWLPQVAETVIVHDARRVAGIDRMVLPEPVARDDVDDRYGRARAERFSDRRVARDRREATLGYQRMYDARTQRYYDMPYETYDAVRGGYVNPIRPGELLERPPSDD